MFQVLSMLICLGSFIWCIFSPVMGWIPIVFASLYLTVTIFALKFRKWKHIDELSEDANELIQRYGHYYTMPFASRDYSAAASTLLFGSLGAAIVGSFKGFWWGWIIAAGVWAIIGPVARAFNPTISFTGTGQELAHNEIVEWLRKIQSD